jgi:hypothetical protein
MVTVTMTDMQMCDRSRLGHAWFDIDDDRSRSLRTVWVGSTVAARCERCTTVRYYGIDVHGEIVSREYVYPIGWKERWSLNGGDRPTTQEIRLLAVRQQRDRRRGK